MSKQSKFLFAAAFVATAFLCPALAHASVESTLTAVQNRLVGTIMPVAATLGLIVSGLSFVAGSPNARTHLLMACLGAAVAFGSSSIISFIQSLVH
jgi:type IV secretory pathway VirB2 component (pilin)